MPNVPPEVDDGMKQLKKKKKKKKKNGQQTSDPLDALEVSWHIEALIANLHGLQRKL